MQNTRIKIKKILFLIPVYKHDVSVVIDRINVLYPNSAILVVDDKAGLKIDKDNVVVCVNAGAKGLFDTLLTGYSESIKYDFDYLVRLDADNEYPIEQLSNMIDRMSFDTAGIVAGFSRSLKMVGLVDYLFHKVWGMMEGRLVIKKPFNQHSPSLQIYRKQTVISFVQALKTLGGDLKIKWGLDILVPKAALLFGDICFYTLKNDQYKERRPLRKIWSQAVASIMVLKLIKKNERILSGEELF